jgi:hypothetical protein
MIIVNMNEITANIITQVAKPNCTVKQGESVQLNLSVSKMYANKFV